MCVCGEILFFWFIIPCSATTRGDGARTTVALGGGIRDEVGCCCEVNFRLIDAIGAISLAWCVVVGFVMRTG